MAVVHPGSQPRILSGPGLGRPVFTPADPVMPTMCTKGWKHEPTRLRRTLDGSTLA